MYATVGGVVVLVTAEGDRQGKGPPGSVSRREPTWVRQVGRAGTERMVAQGTEG